MLAVQHDSQQENSLTLAERRGRSSSETASWNSSLNQPSLGYAPGQYAAQDAGPDLAQEFLRYQRSTAPDQRSSIPTGVEESISRSPLAALSFSGFGMVAGAGEERVTEQFVYRLPNISLATPFDPLLNPSAFGVRVSGPTIKTQNEDRKVTDDAREFDLTKESFAFSA